MSNERFVRNCLLFSALLFFLISLEACKKKRDVFAQPYVKNLGTQSKDAFGLVFTASVLGVIEPCGCTSDPLGGIARFATIFTDMKTALQNNIALIDAGNLLFETPTRIEADRCQDEKIIEVLLSTLSSLGLKKTIPGPLDSARGEDFRNRAYNDHGLKPIPSLVHVQDPMDAAEIYKTPTAHIAVIGISLRNDENVDKANLTNRIRTIKEQSKAKAIIILSQMPREKTREIFINNTDVDIIVQGESSSLAPISPSRIEEAGPWLLEGGEQGQFFSMIVFHHLEKRGEKPLPLDTRVRDRLDRLNLLQARMDALKTQAINAPKDRLDFLNKMIEKAKSEIATLGSAPIPEPLDEPHFIFHQLPINKKIDPDPAAQKKLTDYEKSIPALVKKCEEGLVCPEAAVNEPKFVGVQVCKNCHQAAYEVWTNSVYTTVGKDESGNEIERSSGHSQAWKTLVDASKDADRSCVGCHSIGFMQKGGYCRALEVDFRKNVQCESCHGAGSLHAQNGDKKFIKRKVLEATCRGCHQVPHIQTPESFNYNEMLIKVLGKGHGEKLLQELTHKAKS